MINASFALHRLRLDKPLTQLDVARKLGIAQIEYSNIERGEDLDKVLEALRAVSLMHQRTNRTSGGKWMTGRRRRL